MADDNERMAEEFAAQVEAARAEARAAATAGGTDLPAGYKAPRQRTLKNSKAMAGGDPQGVVNLDRVAENAKKPIPGVDSVRTPLEFTQRLAPTRDDLNHYRVNPDTHYVKFFPRPETDKALGNQEVVGMILRNFPGAYIPEDAEGNKIIEGSSIGIAVPIEYQAQQAETLAKRRSDMDEALAGGKWPGHVENEPAIAQQETEQRRRAERAAQAQSNTRGLSMSEGFTRIGGRKAADAIMERVLTRAPAHDSERETPSDKGRKVFDMGRKG